MSGFDFISDWAVDFSDGLMAENSAVASLYEVWFIKYATNDLDPFTTSWSSKLDPELEM